MNRKPFELWSEVLLAVATLLGYAAFLLVHFKVGVFRPTLGTALGHALALIVIAAPFASSSFVTLLNKRFGVPLNKGRRLFFAEWLLLLCARSDEPSLAFMTVLVILTGHALARGRENSFSNWALAGGLTLTLIGAATVASAHWLWLVPLELCTVGSALVVIHMRRGLAHRESLGRWSFMSDAHEGGRLPSPARLALYGLPFVALTLFAIPLVSLAIVSLPVPMSEFRKASRSRAPIGDTRNANRKVDDAARVAFEGIFPSNLRFGRNVARLRHETVMIVTPPKHVTESELRANGPYYLRGLAQDRFTETGATFSGGDSLLELIPGSNGWIGLSERNPRTQIHLEIHQQPLLTRQGEWNILFSGQPALAIRAEHVKFDPDGVLVSLNGNGSWNRYAVRFGIDDANRWDLDRARAQHFDDRFTQLPPDSPELEQLRREAKRITASASSDSERVGTLVEHFRSQYAYSLTAQDTPGLAGVLSFIERRSGHCTDFASASALMLRTIGIPARVATGFLVADWSDDAGGYAVTTRNGHAWLEVHYESFGWMRYEPTPSARRLRALRAATETEGGFGTWLGDLGSDLTYWASSGVGESDLRLLALTLASGPRSMLVSLRDKPRGAVAILVLLGGAWFGATRLASKRARKRTARGGTAIRAEEDRYAKLLRALAKHGLRKAQTQTPLEFARLVAEARAEWAEILEVTELLYRARFGAEGLTLEERGRFEELTRTVEASGSKRRVRGLAS